MTIEELSENMRFTDNEVIFDKQFYNDVMLKCFINSLSYKKLCQELKNENKKYKEVIDKSIKCIDYNNRYRNDADIYQFVDIKGEILEPLKDILEQNEENSNIYLKEFNDWLKEVG